MLHTKCYRANGLLLVHEMKRLVRKRLLQRMAKIDMTAGIAPTLCKLSQHDINRTAACSWIFKASVETKLIAYRVTTLPTLGSYDRSRSKRQADDTYWRFSDGAKIFSSWGSFRKHPACFKQSLQSSIFSPILYNFPRGSRCSEKVAWSRKHDDRQYGTTTVQRRT